MTLSEGDEAGGTPQLPIRLWKMGPTDDTESFLTTFERIAMATQWPDDQWATILDPYLTSPSQLTSQSLSSQDVLHYFKVKEAILDQLGIAPKTDRNLGENAIYPERGLE